MCAAQDGQLGGSTRESTTPAGTPEGNRPLQRTAIASVDAFFGLDAALSYQFAGSCCPKLIVKYRPSPIF
jgi:hypothetical protein